MDLKILHSWLSEHLTTKAGPTDIAKYLTLSGPTVDRVHKIGSDTLYEIEVTTNRPDAMSVYGIAREVSAILPFYSKTAKLKKLPQYTKQLPKKGPRLTLVSNPKLTRRLTGVIVEDIKNWKSPEWMVKRLESAGARSLNSVVDITNYIMYETGHPCHAFDYAKIPNKKIVVRESKKGEHITTLDGKTYTLSGGDIVFDDGDGNIIDLPGIMGTKNSVVSADTKQVLFFFDNTDPVRIRKTSMEFGIRTMAAQLNEKGVDPELVEVALKRGLILFEKVCKAKVASPIYDVYHKPHKPKTVTTSKENIERVLGINIENQKVTSILKALGFSTVWKANTLTVSVPSYRANDINIPEDISEEVTRIYGYNNLVGKLPSGNLPEQVEEPFGFEIDIKRHLAGWGGSEVYTSSLVSEELVDPKRALALTNPLGNEGGYLRTTLTPSLIEAANTNKHTNDPFHLFEIANTYHKTKNDLPKETLTLAGIFADTDYRKAKGIVESLLGTLGIDFTFEASEQKGFLPSHYLEAKVSKKRIGCLGVLTNNYIYYEFDVELLRKYAKHTKTFKPIPKYPPQVEDITFKFPEKTKIGDVVSLIAKVPNIANTELTDIYKNNYTFRVWYQSKTKTLSDSEVESIRKKIISEVGNKFGGVTKH